MFQTTLRYVHCELQDVKFVTPNGQSVYNAVFKPFKAPANEMFLPMRSAFVYDLEELDSSTDVPTTLRRSKEDCPPVGHAIDIPHPTAALRHC